MEKTNDPKATYQETRILSRRELIKALGAAGGALVTSAFLPSAWRKPSIEAGKLPDHALITKEGTGFAFDVTK